MKKNESELSLSNEFDSMASEFAGLVRHGKSPDIEEFARRNEDLADRVLRLFPVLELMERNGLSDSEDDPHKSLLKSEKWQAPKRLGDYRLIRQIGRGGMGVVYEAEQESLGRRVAIKILPTSAQFDERRTERFATEAKASAMLHHTNIVPVFGVGREDELSFFVMQYIDGQPLSQVLRDITRIRDLTTKPLQQDETTFSNRAIVHSMFGEPIPIATQESDDEATTHPDSVSLPGSQTLRGSGSESASLIQSVIDDNSSSGTRTRNYFRNVARVGVKVSEALDHAHSQGILHRDIKPSNLLLDSQGSVWVTDFGLAKSFDSPDITRTGEVVGTLRYMSPEQLEGNASSSSDIFGLGLTLYEMLTLQPAYPGIDKKRLLEKVTEANPVNPRSIDSRIPRDLETIVMKCIHSEPSKRYASAAEVGEDLNRFLDGQPILARRIGVVEKAWKWCCRRPKLAASYAALATSILLGIIGVGWHWRNTSEALVASQANFVKAEKATKAAEEATAIAVQATTKANAHYQQARSAVVQITESISNEQLLTSPDLLPVRRKLLLKALDYQIEFVKSHPDDVDVKIELAEAYTNLAAVSHELAKSEDGKEFLVDSQTILDAILKLDLDPKDKERAIICLAETFSLAGEIAMRESPDGQFYAFKAVRVLLNERKESELSTKELLKLSELNHRLGDAYNGQNTGRARPIRQVTELARDHYRKSFEIVEQIFAEDKTNKDYAKILAGAHRNLGTVNRRLKQFDVALKHYSASVNQFRDLVASEPDNTDFRYGLARALSSLAYYYDFSAKDADMAIPIYTESIGEYQKLSKAYPSVLKFSEGESKASMNFSLLYEREDRSREAYVMRKRALVLSEKALLFAPNDAKLLSDYGKALMGMGLNHKKRREYDTALEYLSKARVQHESAVEIAPNSPTFEIRLCRTLNNISFTYQAIGKFDAAHKTLLDAIDNPNPDAEVMYMTGRALLVLVRYIRDKSEDRSESDLQVATQAVQSAKGIFEKMAGPKLGMRERILSDRKLKSFVASESGASFMKWFSTAETRFANDMAKRRSKKR